VSLPIDTKLQRQKLQAAAPAPVVTEVVVQVMEVVVQVMEAILVTVTAVPMATALEAVVNHTAQLQFAIGQLHDDHAHHVAIKQ